MAVQSIKLKVNPMFAETLKKEWYVLVLLLVPFAVSAYLWNDLPDIVPTHFNAAGEADDWGPKWINAILIPSIGIVTYLMLVFLPAIDPKKKIQAAQKPIAAIRLFMSVFMVGIYAFVMSSSMGSTINFGIYVQTGVGALIFIVGNYINSVKPNYFIGIRTPWTLESPEVWKRTHRLGSKLWIVGGLIMMIFPWFGFASATLYFTIIMVSILAGIPLVYSYIIFKKLDTDTAS